MCDAFNNTTMTISGDGTKEFRMDGFLGRIDGHSVEYTNGDLEWFEKNKLHRVGEPAVVRTNGDREWWQFGKLHNTDGPAIIWADGEAEWYINGTEMTEEAFNKLFN